MVLEGQYRMSNVLSYSNLILLYVQQTDNHRERLHGRPTVGNKDRCNVCFVLSESHARSPCGMSLYFVSTWPYSTDCSALIVNELSDCGDRPALRASSC